MSTASKGKLFREGKMSVVQQALHDGVLAGLREWRRGLGPISVYSVHALGDEIGINDPKLGTIYIAKVRPDGSCVAAATFYMTADSVVVLNSGDLSVGGHVSYGYDDCPVDKLVPYMLRGL